MPCPCRLKIKTNCIESWPPPGHFSIQITAHWNFPRGTFHAAWIDPDYAQLVEKEVTIVTLTSVTSSS